MPRINFPNTRDHILVMRVEEVFKFEKDKIVIQRVKDLRKFVGVSNTNQPLGIVFPIDFGRTTGGAGLFKTRYGGSAFLTASQLILFVAGLDFPVMAVVHYKVISPRT